jgi:hypothetical protein
MGLTPEAAAARAKIRISGRRWRQIEDGEETHGGKPAVAGDSQLAHMAAVVGVDPDELDKQGRAEAGEILRAIKHREESQPAGRDIAAFFRDQSIPIEERRRAAEELWRILPWVFRGEEPPRSADRDGEAGRLNG